GNSVGLYMCTDLACSLYLRGKKVLDSGARFEESLTLEEQIARARGNLSAFLDKLYA
ncbi:FBP domain-containing protein, partial [Streptomyces sp. NPDC006356]